MSLDAIQGGRASMVYGLRVSLPSDTIQIGNAPYTSKSGGHFQGLGESFEPITRAVSGRDGKLPAVETRFTFRDHHDRRIQKTLARYRAKDLRGSRVQLFRMVPSLSAASWSFAFDGQFIRWGQRPRLLLEITARTNDEQLQRPSTQATIDSNTWPNADPTAYNFVAPILYGYHDASTSRVSPGFVPTLLVDKGNYRYLVCVGRAKTLMRVYVDGSQISAARYGSAFEYLTNKGRLYSLIKFNNLTDAPTAGQVVTVDAAGYDEVGNGTGLVLDNPADQVQHFLSNFVLAQYMTGNWLPHHALIDPLNGESSRMYYLGAKGSLYRSVRITGSDALALYCTSFQRSCFWSADFKISFGAAVNGTFDEPYSGNVLNWAKQEMKPATFSEKDYNVTSGFTTRQCFASSDGKFVQTLEIEDASAPIRSVSDLERPWSEAR